MLACKRSFKIKPILYSKKMPIASLLQAYEQQAIKPVAIASMRGNHPVHAALLNDAIVATTIAIV
jgi:hypothetical protein